MMSYVNFIVSIKQIIEQKVSVYSEDSEEFYRIWKLLDYLQNENNPIV